MFWPLYFTLLLWSVVATAYDSWRWALGCCVAAALLCLGRALARWKEDKNNG